MNEKDHGVVARIYKNAGEASYEAQLKEAKAELQAQKVSYQKRHTLWLDVFVKRPF